MRGGLGVGIGDWVTIWEGGGGEWEGVKGGGGCVVVVEGGEIKRGRRRGKEKRRNCFVFF